MGLYIVRRVLVMIPTLVAISIVAFIIIQLPPGDYLTIYVAQLREQGDIVDELVINRLQQRYGLGQPRSGEPGTVYRESDAGYVLLGVALERATGRSAEELLADADELDRLAGDRAHGERGTATAVAGKASA